MDQKVFRLSRIPAVFDKSGVEKLLGRELALQSDVKVFSLAQSVGPFFQTKTATLMFKEGSDIRKALLGGKIPHVSKFGDQEWTIDVVDLHSPIILDTHFSGLTPLDDPDVHTLDCIAISGLSSHPFGSWQPRGQEKKFMWIRDSLKKEVPGLRPILYGYDSALLDSDSFQSIPDLAKDLLAQLEMGGLTHSSSKPLIFLAHSLGGLILKQAMVSNNSLCVNTRGAIFFGVPNLGMDQSSLLTMVEGQANESLVRDLAVESAYLLQLNGLFFGLPQLEKMLIYWAYETQESAVRTEEEPGQWVLGDCKKRLVTMTSATAGLPVAGSGPDRTYPINANHSEIVKFTEDHWNHSTTAGKLLAICKTAEDLRDDHLTEAEAIFSHGASQDLDVLNPSQEREGQGNEGISEPFKATKLDIGPGQTGEESKRAFKSQYSHGELGFPRRLKHVSRRRFVILIFVLILVTGLAVGLGLGFGLRHNRDQSVDSAISTTTSRSSSISTKESTSPTTTGSRATATSASPDCPDFNNTVYTFSGVDFIIDCGHDYPGGLPGNEGLPASQQPNVEACLKGMRLESDKEKEGKILFT